MQHEWRTPQISTNSVERLGKTWHPEMAQLILPLALTPFFPQVPDLGTETPEPRMARILFEFQRMIGVRPFGCSMVFLFRNGNDAMQRPLFQIEIFLPYSLRGRVNF